MTILRSSLRIALALIVMITGPAFATSAARMVSLPLSVRQLGMGDVSAGGSDILRAWSNPSLVLAQRTQGEVALNGSSLFGAEAATQGFGFGYRMSESLAFGALFSRYSIAFDQVDGLGQATGSSLEQTTMSGGAVAAYGQDFWKVGLGARFVSDAVAGSSVSAFAGDLGAQATYRDATISAAVRGLGTGLGESAVAGASAETLPVEIRGGASYRIRSARVLVGAEVVKTSDTDMRAGLGLEWWPVQMLGLRAGMAGIAETQRQFTLGLSAMYERVGLDYALGAHPLGAVHRVSLTYAFGPAIDKEPVYEWKIERSGLLMPKILGAQTRAAKRVAVANFEVAGGVKAADGDGVVSQLRAELSKQRGAIVPEKSEMEEVMTGTYFTKTGCTSIECASKLGRLLKVHYVVVGRFEKLLGRYFINVRLINVATKQVVVTEVVRGADVDDIEKGVISLARKIADKL